MSSSSPLDRRTLELLGHVVIALKSFEGKYHMKFNFSELAKYLRLSEHDTRYLAEFIIHFQGEIAEFSRIFRGYVLQKRQEHGITYLFIGKDHKMEPDMIRLNKEQAGWLSDLIYTFHHVKKGKGFDLSNHHADLVKHLRLLMQHHPYFFEKNGSEVVYPSRLASELGLALLSSKKLNRPVHRLTILGHVIEVK